MILAIIALLIFSEAFPFTESLSSAFKGPENTIAYLGQTVSMRCSLGSLNCSDFTWKRQTVTDIGNPKSVFSGSGIVNVDRERYSVDSTSGCHVIIRDVKYEDSGRFSCEAVLPNKTTSVRSGYLAVFESKPECKVNVSSNASESTVEGDTITSTCELTHPGAKVTMTWKDLANFSGAETTGNTTKLSYTFAATSSEIQPLVCDVLVEMSDKPRDGAMNPLSDSCQTAAVEVLYHVRNVHLSPSSSSFPPGSKVLCIADGNPPPVIRWQSLKAENPSTWKDIPGVNGSELVIGSDMSERYRCVAENSVRNKTQREFSCQISAGESSESGIGSAGIGIGFAVGFVSGVLLSAIVVVLCFRMHCTVNF